MTTENDRRSPSVSDRIDAVDETVRKDRAVLFHIFGVDDPDAREIPRDYRAELRVFFVSGVLRQRSRIKFREEVWKRGWQVLTPISVGLLGYFNAGTSKLIQALWHRIFG